MTDSKVTSIEIKPGDLVNKIQDVNLALSLIEQIRGGAARRLPFEALEEVMSALILDMPYVGYKLRVNDVKFFRGRRGNSTNFLEKATEISYRIPESVKDYGRCHRPGTSMFYCSSNMDTVLAELAPEIGDRVFVGVGSIKNSHELAITAIGEIDYSRRYHRPVIGNQEAFHTLNKILSKIRKENSELHTRILVTDAFFADLFAQAARKQYEYRPTSVLAKLLLSSGIDGFAYPSVEHRGGINYAIRPEKFDEHMEWKEIIALDVAHSLGFGLYGYKVTAKASTVDADGSIVWQSS